MKMTIPNILSLSRIAAAPFLIVASYYGSEKLFFILFSLMLVSDVLDGYIARKLHQCSKIGSKLDSIGDFVTYLSLPLSVWWLWPEIIKAEFAYIVATVLIYLLPGVVALVKFHQPVAYHTWLTKVTAVAISVGIILLLFTKNSLFFHFAIAVLALEAAENILITLILSRPQTNVRSLWHIVRKK